MNKEKDPAFLMYPKDWITGTAEYMPDEKGVYIDLLCHQHQKNGLPNDTQRLAKMIGISHDVFIKIWTVISPNFIQIDDKYFNLKLKNIMNDRSQRAKINRISGTFAGILRKGNYNAKTYKMIRSAFKPYDFIDIEKENITERLTDWITNWFKNGQKALEMQMQMQMEIYNINKGGVGENNIEKRKGEFSQLVYECDPLKYSQDLLKKFTDYWTEKNKSGTKMRFELQKTFEISKRLATWKSNEEKFQKHTKPEYHATDF